MKIIKFRSTLFTLLIGCCFLYQTACTGKKESGKMVFYYNETTGIATLDPAFAKNQSIMWAIHQVYNTLVEIDSNLNIVPSLAKSWEIDAGRTTYTFHLRNDVYFHDSPVFPGGKGRKMVADDVVFSLNRIIDKNTASSGAWIFNKRVDTVHPFTTINDSTFQVKLLRPFHPILGILSMQYCSIIPKEAVLTYGKDFRRNPCGTGPFRFISWDEGEALVLHRNEQYWEKDKEGERLPYLDAIQVSFFDNKATEFLQFRQGKLSFINDIDPSFKDELLTKKGELRKEWQGRLHLNKTAYLNTEYFGILVDEQNPLVKKSPVRLKLVRQAMNYAINRPQLMMYMRNSIGIPAEAGFVPGGLPSRNVELVKGYTYDPGKARQLLKQAGFTDTRTIPAITLLTIPIYADIASFVAKQMEEIGLPVQVEVIQKSLLLEQTAKSQALFFRGSWIADYPDAENYMAMFYSKNPAPPNYTRYKNPVFDQLYEQALLETNDSARYALYRTMDQLVINDAPVIPIWYDMAIHFVQNNVQGFRTNALNLLELRRVKLVGAVSY
ncbi:peptide/nickel transport system substrate-binding protein [Sediminibacterium goheungense]|uniref:Peptide/nickel transport system substrate-binding protein n=1 Tax=Sediminibacterium goheungense TaxID=1086393 RepID=A0A4R6IRQ8_9BACT|nr:peptide/nickel transport system substrate-binding protein [Sediminibacterium goheungense]TDO25093.1 peptide/nickel transport system substrate-binding protein [Sediminibacterium goheungense]